MIEDLNWKPFPKQTKFKLMSCVGWDSIIGGVFQSYCDWCIGVRYPLHEPTRLYGNPKILPKTIFLSIRNIDFFLSNIFDFIPKDHKYILIIGNEDMTFPNQTDTRYKESFLNQFAKLYSDTRIAHIFSNHLDIREDNKISALPLGFDSYVYSSPQWNRDKHSNIDWLLSQEPNIDILNKPLKVRGFDRIRGGSQWSDRVIVKNLSNSNWVDFVDYGEFPTHEICQVLNNYSFSFCPKGGGLEPNPKIFTSIYCGVIPIVKTFVNSESLYKDLPVAFIPDWKPEYVTIEKLKTWRESFKDYFYNQDKRKQVLYKLTTDYWKEYIQNQSKVDFQLFN